MGLERLLKVWRPDRRDITFALRVTVAAVLALFAALAFGLPMPLWSVLTSVIVSQLSIGRTLKIGTSYFLGTIGGSVYGGLIAVFVPHGNEAALLAVLVLAVAPLALYSATHPNMNVVPVSAIIVLLMPALSHRDPVHSAIDRILEVAVGAAVGLLVAFLVAPSSAHRLLRAAAAGLLERMAAALGELTAGVLNGMPVDALNRVQDRIGAAVIEVDAMGGEAERERSIRLTSGAETAGLRRTLLRLRHDLVFFGRAIGSPPDDTMRERLSPPLDALVGATSTWLLAAAAALRAGDAPPSVEPLKQALDAWTAAVAALRRDGVIRDLSGEAAERFFAAGFALEQMHHDLQDLARIVADWRAPGMMATPR